MWEDLQEQIKTLFESGELQRLTFKKNGKIMFVLKDEYPMVAKGILEVVELIELKNK